MSVPRSEWVLFKGPIEALFTRALRGKMDAALKDKLRGHGIDLDKDLLPAYPHGVFRACLRETLTHLYGPNPTAENQRELGTQWTDSFFETFMGKAVLGVLRLIGPRRAMLRSAQNYRSVNNFAEAKVVELGPGHFELWLHDENDWPELGAGSLQRSVELAGAKNARATMLRREGEHNVFEARWDV